MRGLLYALARMLGDSNALLKGDVHRISRKKAGARGGGWLNKWMR